MKCKKIGKPYNFLPIPITIVSTIYHDNHSVAIVLDVILGQANSIPCFSSTRFCAYIRAGGHFSLYSNLIIQKYVKSVKVVK